MAALLAAYRIIAVLLSSIWLGILSIPSQLTPGIKGVRRVSRFVYRWNARAARIANVRVTIDGKLPAVSGGLVVSNHLSYIDILVYGSTLPFRYAPKTDLKDWPLLGWYIGLSRPVWVDRASKQASKRTLEEFAETMREEMYLMVFPEGTTTDGEHGILPFKSTPFEAAIAGNAPIIPALISYKKVAGRPTVCWYGDMTFLPHLWNILRFPSIEAHVRFLAPVYPEGRSRKELAAHVHAVMAAEYDRRLR